MRILTVSGRDDRRVFTLTLIALFVVDGLTTAMMDAVFTSHVLPVVIARMIDLGMNLGIIALMVMAAARRLHDLGTSGVYALGMALFHLMIALGIAVGTAAFWLTGMLVLIYGVLAIIPGEDSANRWGKPIG